jgi:hypothetical protein
MRAAQGALAQPARSSPYAAAIPQPRAPSSDSGRAARRRVLSRARGVRSAGEHAEAANGRDEDGNPDGGGRTGIADRGAPVAFSCAELLLAGSSYLLLERTRPETRFAYRNLLRVVLATALGAAVVVVPGISSLERCVAAAAITRRCSESSVRFQRTSWTRCCTGDGRSRRVGDIRDGPSLAANRSTRAPATALETSSRPRCLAYEEELDVVVTRGCSMTSRS